MASGKTSGRPLADKQEINGHGNYGGGQKKAKHHSVLRNPPRLPSPRAKLPDQLEVPDDRAVDSGILFGCFVHA
jgi:hypothetical protein